MGKIALVLVAFAFAGCEGSDVLSPLPSPVSPDNVMVSGLTLRDATQEVMIMGAPGAAPGAAKVRVTRVSTKVALELTASKGGSFGSTFEAAEGDEFEIVVVGEGGRASAATKVKVPPAMAMSAAFPPKESDTSKPPVALTDLGGGKHRLAGWIGPGQDAAVLNLTAGAAFVGVADAEGLVDMTIDASPCDVVGMFVIDPANRENATCMKPMETSCPK